MMQDYGMDLLDTGRGRAWNDNLVVAEPLGQSTIFAADEYGRQADLLSLAESRKDVRTVTAGAEADQDISRASECFDLPRKNMIIAVIIPNACQHRYIRIDADGGQWATFCFVAANKFFGKMESIGGTATISASQNLPLAMQTSQNGSPRVHYGVFQASTGSQQGGKH